jgi:YfiH family protein
MTDPGLPGVIRPDWPAPANVRAFSTTRSGGCSRGPWASLNLGARCGDEPGHVSRNRQLLRAVLPAEPRWLRQVHGAGVVDIDATSGEPSADAAMTRMRGQVCAVLTADCLPLLLCNRAGTAVAAVHAGWRGLAAGVVQASVTALACETGSLIAWLGPAIGPQAFEVGRDVFTAFTRASPEYAAAFTACGQRWYADLYELARLALKSVGVASIWGGQYCTYTQADTFFSHRRDGVTGRMASVIWLD